MDIECHGSEDCIELSDRTTLSWEHIKPKIEAINIASRFNLILVLGCCNDGCFARATRLREPSAFCAYVAPTSSLSAGSLYDGLSAFYRSLFVDRDINTAMIACGRPLPLSIQDMMQIIRKESPGEFERCRQAYFAIDAIPENNTRYALRYEDVLNEGGEADPGGFDAL